MVPPTYHELLSRNEKHAASHSPLPSLSSLQADASNRGTNPFIITCIDPRIMPQSIFDLKPLDAFISRNVCGHPHNALPDILAIDELIEISAIILLHHSDCGALHFSNEWALTRVKERLPSHLHNEVEQMNYGGIGGLHSIEEDVKRDVAWVRENKFIREELRSKVYGCVYDIETGVVKTIEAPSK